MVASAPGRVNLIGEHTDYNGGEVLPIGIAQRTFVAARRASGTTSRARSANQPLPGEWNAIVPASTGDWCDYLAGVQRAVNSLAPRSTALGALEIAVVSDVPAGAGLSSSAALEVAGLTAMAHLADVAITPMDVAREAQRVESEFVGVACGIMDQFASALAESGRALHIWCDSGRVEDVPIDDAVMIFDTALPRELRSSRFNTRRAECEQALVLLRVLDPSLAHLAAASTELLERAELPAPLYRRAKHVVEETARVRRVVEQLRAGGTLDGTELNESHESLRDLYDCSTPELDWFVERASNARRIRGARLTGAGWGGCAIAVADERTLVDIAPEIAADYRRRFDLEPRVWLTRAEAGSRVDTQGK